MEEKTLIDDYEHLSVDVEYVLENILQEDDGSDEFKELKELYNSIIVNNCECENCCDKCSHGENYRFDDEELVLKEDRRCEDLIYECSEACNCLRCFNKLVQYGPRCEMKIVNYDTKGFGLVSTKEIKKGSFICEYAGEILTKSEATRRDHQNQTIKKMNYIFCLNEINSSTGSAIQTFIDPSLRGNIGRYINHSCDANCDIISVRVDNIIPKIAIFANRHIPPLAEITFNYGHFEQEHKINKDNKKLCFCKSYNCQFYLPNFSF